MKTEKKVSTEELTKLIRKTGMLRIEIRGPDNQAFHVPITVLGVRQAYGRTDLRVKNTAGLGEAWVSHKIVTID